MLIFVFILFIFLCFAAWCISLIRSRIKTNKTKEVKADLKSQVLCMQAYKISKMPASYERCVAESQWQKALSDYIETPNTKHKNTDLHQNNVVELKKVDL